MAEIYDTQLLSNTREIAKQVIQWINAIGLMVGIIAINLSDVIFGGIMLSMILHDIDILFGIPMDGWFAGFVISFSFWFIQLVLWDRIFSNSIIDWMDINVLLKNVPALVLAIIVAVIDTNIDSAPLFIWTLNVTALNTLHSQTVFNKPVDEIVMVSLVVGFYIVNMFSEVFNVWYLSNTTMKYPRNNTKLNKTSRAHSRRNAQFNRNSNIDINSEF